MPLFAYEMAGVQKLIKHCLGQGFDRHLGKYILFNTWNNKSNELYHLSLKITNIVPFLLIHISSTFPPRHVTSPQNLKIKKHYNTTITPNKTNIPQSFYKCYVQI